MRNGSDDMTKALEGTVALITGASSGIGAATARALAEAGASLVLVARRKDRLDALAADIGWSGGQAFAIAADITHRDQAEAAVEGAIARFGRIDVLVNNAGVMALGATADQDVDAWERMIDLNQKGLLYVTKAALPHLKASAADASRGVADIVNVSSLAGRLAMANFAVYNMTKFGVTAFSEALRQELASDHVRVGVVEPGATVTELNDHHEGAIKDWVDGFFEAIEPLEASDIADGIAFMVTRNKRTAIRELFILPTEQA
jgi:NADP-dependent 3-hydroxy acid dehydrogenase YdfG